MKKLLLFSFLLIFSGVRLYAQKSFWDSKNAYFGLTTPGDTPIVFAPVKLKTGNTFTVDRCAFSPDGSEFYYSVNNTWFGDSNLATMMIRFRNRKWGTPELLAEHFYAPTFSPDGKTIFLQKGGISRITRTSTGWTKPQPYINSRYSFYDYILTRSGRAYVGGSPDIDSSRSYANWDICRVSIKGNDTTLVSLGAPLNTPGFDGDFCISPDESYIIISAKEQPDFECELWISFRKPDDSWTPPVSLGPLINDGPAHRWGQYVSPDGKYLFYSHGHGPEDCSIMWVRFDKLLEKARKESM